MTVAGLTMAVVLAQAPGRQRDPFVSLLAVAPESEEKVAARADGLPGLSVDDITITGVLTHGDEALAILAGPDGAMYIARRSDRLKDAVIEAIDAGGIVFTVTPSASNGMPRPRTIRKALRRAGGGMRWPS